MLLAIDVGNSNTVLGCYWDGRLKRTWRVATHPLCTADEFRAKIFSLFSLEGIELSAVTNIVVSSVVPTMSAMLREAFKDYIYREIDHRWPFSFKILAAPADHVGMDRLVNAEAAIRDYGAPLILIDSGTATTLCAISKEREYLGGAIMPGVELSLETLTRKTAKLFSIDLQPPAHAIGKNTQQALQSGLLLGYASMIDGMIARFKKELRNTADVKIVATGGIGRLLQGLSTEIHHYDPDLTLRGIAYLFEAITEKERAGE